MACPVRFDDIEIIHGLALSTIHGRRQGQPASTGPHQRGRKKSRKQFVLKKASFVLKRGGGRFEIIREGLAR